MNQKTKNRLIIAVVLLVLAALVTVLAVLNRPESLPESGTLEIVLGEERIGFTMEQLQAMEAVEVEKEIVSSSFANDKGTFRGVSLRVLLENAGVALDDAAQIIVRSEDGFVAAFPADEVRGSDGIFLAYSKDGQSLGTLEDGGSGPFRIVVTDDAFGNRCAKYVCEIEVI